MKARWISVGVVIGLALALTLGFGFASARTGSAGTEGPSDWWAAMERMHDSPAMEQMHSRMPEELQQQCDALHDRMDPMIGSGMMGGSAGTGSTAGGMMGGNGAGPGMMSPSGMMGW